MYQHKENNSMCFSLHDCRAEKMYFSDGILSFVLPEGFWVLSHCIHNESENVVRTDSAQVDFSIIDEEKDGISIFVFKKSRNGNIIREEWGCDNFINVVNDGSFQLEFIDEYKGFQSRLFKCWVWFDKKPYHYECEIILHSEEVTYLWNQLRNDCVW